MTPIRAVSGLLLPLLAACAARSPAPLAASPPPAQPALVSPPPVIVEAPPLAGPPAATPDPDLLDITRLPIVDVTPDPVYGSELAFPEDERASARPIDYRNGPLARLAGPSDHAGLAVVIARSKANTRDPQAQDWMRFLQGNPEVSPLSFGCTGGADAERAFEAYMLAPGPDGSMRYRRTHGWFNFAACRGAELRRHETPVVPVAGGLAYAYLSRCQDCGEVTGLTMLNLVMPRPYGSLNAADGRFVYWTMLAAHVALLLSPGSSGSISARFEPDVIAAWNRVAPAPLPVRTHRMRVEVTFAHGDAEPTVLVALE